MFAVGVRASERLAEMDMPSLLRYRPVMRAVGQKYCVDPAVIAGVLSRQPHGSSVLASVGAVGDGVKMVQVACHQSLYLICHFSPPKGFLHIC